MKQRYTKNERLGFIIEVITSIRNFKGENGDDVNLYNEEFGAIKMLKEVFDAYLNQNDDTSVSFEGSIKFEELNRKIQYRLPAFSPHKPLVIMKKPN